MIGGDGAYMFRAPPAHASHASRAARPGCPASAAARRGQRHAACPSEGAWWLPGRAGVQGLGGGGGAVSGRRRWGGGKGAPEGARSGEAHRPKQGL
jgi:hypothetical protein